MMNQDPYKHRVTSKKIFLCLFYLTAFAIPAFSQRMDWKSSIDFIVERTDSLSMKSQKTFYIPKIIRVDRTFKNDKTIKETWNYTVNEGKVIIFQIRYVIDYREYTEVYYLDNDRLICMEYYETPYLATYIDEVRKGEIFFLVNNTVKQYIRFGKTQDHDGRTDAESECLTRFDQRYAELRKNIKLPNRE